MILHINTINLPPHRGPGILSEYKVNLLNEKAVYRIKQNRTKVVHIKDVLAC